MNKMSLLFNLDRTLMIVIFPFCVERLKLINFLVYPSLGGRQRIKKKKKEKSENAFKFCAYESYCLNFIYLIVKLDFNSVIDWLLDFDFNFSNFDIDYNLNFDWIISILSIPKSCWSWVTMLSCRNQSSGCLLEQKSNGRPPLLIFNLEPTLTIVMLDLGWNFLVLILCKE